MPLFLAQTGDRTSRGSAAAIPGLVDTAQLAAMSMTSGRLSPPEN